MHLGGNQHPFLSVMVEGYRGTEEIHLTHMEEVIANKVS